MKTHQKKFNAMRCLIVLALFLGFSSLHAVELVNEQFTTSTSVNSWTRSSTSNVYWTSTNNNSMFMDRNDWAVKTYAFGADYANQPLTVVVNWCATSQWESNQDYLRVRINDSGNFTHYDDGGCQQLNFTASADGSGNFKIQFSPITNSNNEDAYIDWFTVNGTPIGGVITENADDICFSDEEYSGFMCMDIGFCKGGIGCTTSYPIKNISNDDLTNVVLYYNEDGMGGSAFSNCSVDPSGTCSAKSDIDFGPVGIFGSATEFSFNNPIEPDDTDAKISMNLAFSGSCLNSDSLYATYQKNGVTYRGKVSRCVETEVNDGLREFELRNPLDTRNVRGDLGFIGNTVMCVKQSGACYNYTGGSSNTDLDLRFIDVDTDPTTYNSSQALVNIPEDAEIIWAALYTQGFLGKYSKTQTQEKLEEPVLVNISTLPRISSVPDVVDFYAYGSDGYTYATFTELNELVGKKGSDVNGWTTVANIKAVEGNDPSPLGNFGAWTMAYIYTYEGATYKNISIFDGYKKVADATGFKTVNITVDGFVTPVGGDINASLSVFVGEGDKNINGDKLYVDGEVINDTNAFDSSISGVTRSPSFTNNQGIDIQNHDISHILEHKQQSATITLTSTQDAYFPSVVAFTAELYVPEFCYDYAYRQNGVYFTEMNDGTEEPRLVGTVDDTPIEMGIYIKNFVESDMVIKDMKIDVVDINTSQVRYDRNSVEITPLNNIIPLPVADSSLSVSDSYVKGVPVGQIEQNDYFYLYYDLDPQRSTLDTPINVRATYTLEFNGVASERTLKLGTELKLCTDNNFRYRPAKSIFNVVHKNYYNKDEGVLPVLEYNNLPTQVVKREGNFKIVALDPDDLVTPVEMNTTVAIELFDASAFHDFNASCNQLTSSISDRVWIMFHDTKSVDFDRASINNAINNNLTRLTQSADFYKNARRNVGFRVSYNVTNDGNEDLVKVTPGSKPNTYKINFVELTQNVGVCAQDMDGNVNNTDMVPQWCGNNSDKLTEAEIATCMECVYGYNTRFICSRDNFALRPEAFHISLYDQNQTTGTRLGGEFPKTPNDLDLAAGYRYKAEVNATTHLDSLPAAGYNATLDVINNDFGYIWNLRTVGINAANCNDTEDHKESVKFSNGYLETNTSIEQVGEYKFTVTDKTWTAVDYVPSNMLHHDTEDNFLPSSVADCYNHPSFPEQHGRVRSNNPYPTTDILNGCEIRSDHNNTDANLTYSDYNVTFHPYKFDVSSIVPSIGFQNDPVGANSFVYMADISNTDDENMSVHFNGSIFAEGYNNEVLSNFVDGCFAKPLDLNLSSSVVVGVPNYIYRFKTVANSGSVTLQNTNEAPTNATVVSITDINTTGFQKTLEGELKTIFNLNITREVNASVNPQRITYNNYDINCTLCRFNADGIEYNRTIPASGKTAFGRTDLNTTVTYYYGRSYAPRQVFPTQSGTVPIFYEIYCDNNVSRAFLPVGSIPSKEPLPSPIWYTNTLHTNTFGGANRTVTRKSGGTRVEGTNTLGTMPDMTNVTYDGSRGFPYSTTMQHNVNMWLVYDKDNANSISNEFEVEFIGGQDGSWAGKTDTNAETDTTAAPITNRRIMW
jgi:hypothetical protein